MLDRLRSFFAPRGQARSYDGAAGGRRWRAAGEMPAPLSAQLSARGPLARRARYLCANNAMAAAGADAWVSALAGTGIRPTSTNPVPDFRAAAASSFEAWTDVADLDGLGDFYALQALVARRLVIDGEAFVVLSHALDGSLRLRVLDAEQIDPSMNRELPSGGRIISGIEFDAAGSRVAYHILPDPPSLPFVRALDAVRVPADLCLHVFRAEVAGQVRGVSWFAPVLLRLAELDSAHDAQLVRQKVAALLTGFVVDPNGTAGGFTGELDGMGGLEGGLEPGTLKVLNPGQDVRFSDPAKVGAEVIDFLKTSAREIAAGLGVPASVLMGDFSDANYSSLRASLLDFRRRVEAIQHHVMVFRLCRPIWRAFVTAEVLAGRLGAPGFERDPEAFLSARWITPRTDWVDPAKDVQAELDAIAGGLMSRRQAVEARGLAVEELDAEIAADRAREATLGLTFGASTTNHPNNPEVQP
ncbi:phage portal protein [Xanthobacter sp. DSM 14520]|uniref:phage portal protein n=1 Tax=Xanthobacter autotrophicus (strain ATCC BAA-1158 / Py2) TaxID=78245 RepID=UPI003727F8FF